MRATVICARRHGSTEIEVIGAPSESGVEQKKKFGAFTLKKTDPDFSHVWICNLEPEREMRLKPEAPEGEEAPEPKRKLAAKAKPEPKHKKTFI